MTKTDKPLPEFVNSRRRRNLYRYTLMAMLSYQIPIGVAYLSKVLDLALYDYTDINYSYLAFISCSISAFAFIWLKKTITKRYIYFVLHYQVVLCMLISAYLVYVMSDQRYLVPIGCLLVLMFVFIQSSMVVSCLTIVFVLVVYLAPAYVGMRYGGQPGSFISEILYIMVLVPVCIFIAYMSKIMQDQQKKIKNTNSKLRTAHTELEVTYSKLEITYSELEEHNERMLESIRYAELIQRSLLPGIERIKTVSPDSMFIWIPKDIVGGDIFYTWADPEGSLIALMDCTGHGVPGAFLTMIVYSEIRKIVMDEGCRDPAEILQRLNSAVKNVLHKHEENTNADDGLDAAICVIDYSGRRVIYAGARIPLFYMKNDQLVRENGDKQSIGYKDSDEQYAFTNYTIDVDGRCSFYMKTDGYTDQLGGGRRRRFGTDKFKQLILDHHHQTFSEQRKLFLQELMKHQGEVEQIDDITLIGFNV